jgi:two-component system, NarL family, sensor kinase
MRKWIMFSLCLLLLPIHTIIAQPANSNSSNRSEVHGKRSPKPMDVFKCSSEKKDLEILKSEKEIIAIRKKYMLIYLLIIISSLFCLTFLTYRNIQNKRIIAELDKNIQQYKIQQLDNEKILLATQRILQDEENRKGLAHSLHDKLGGLLSGVKITLNNMKGNAVLTCEMVNGFNHVLNTLDSSIDELKTVAHNMMPEALIDLGLKDSLADLCSELDKTLDQHIIFQFFGQFERLDSYFEINAYTLMQELIMNSIKNSCATKLVIQMIQETNRLCFMVIDNGPGLDLSKETDMHNIRARTDAFNGQLEINVIPGKGTEFTIEFTI